MAKSKSDIPVLDLKGKSVGSFEGSSELFGIEPNEQAVHFACEGQRWAFYAKTSSTKTRSEVNFTGKKPRKQKGGGTSRQGDVKSPHFVGGGVAFGPQPIKREFKVNRKVKKLALASILSDRHSGGQVRVLQADLSAPKTKTMEAFLETLELSNARVGFVVSRNESDLNLAKSIRNLQKVDLLSEEKWTALNFIKVDCLVFSEKAISEMTQKFQNA